MSILLTTSNQRENQVPICTWQRQLAIVVQPKGMEVAVRGGCKGGVGAAVDIHNLVADAPAAACRQHPVLKPAVELVTAWACRPMSVCSAQPSKCACTAKAESQACKLTVHA